MLASTKKAVWCSLQKAVCLIGVYSNSFCWYICESGTSVTLYQNPTKLSGVAHPYHFIFIVKWLTFCYKDHVQFMSLVCFCICHIYCSDPLHLLHSLPSGNMVAQSLFWHLSDVSKLFCCICIVTLMVVIKKWLF